MVLLLTFLVVAPSRYMYHPVSLLGRVLVLGEVHVATPPQVIDITSAPARSICLLIVFKSL